MRRVTVGISAAGLCWQASVAAAQVAGAAPDARGPERVVAGPEAAAVVAGVLDSLRAAYVFPDSVPAIAAALRARARRGAYDGLTARALADSLTAHLRAARPDGHLRVVYAPEAAGPAASTATAEAPAAATSAADAARGPAAARRASSGVARVERLPGNVGVLALSEFAEPEDAGPALAAAMTLLAHTDALIVDLRASRGGAPPTVALLASYLLGPHPVHLLSFYYRPTNRTFASWTRATVPGPRYGARRPVYVLSSRRTRSAAEAFAYTLQHLGRVTVVGDTTAGAAHPGRDRPVGSGFAVFVPDGRPTSPVTHTNWEGTGIAPDVPVPAARALQTAYVGALRTLAGRARDPEQRREVAGALDAALAAEAGRSAPEGVAGHAPGPVSAGARTARAQRPRRPASTASPPRGIGTLLRELLERLDGDVDRLYDEAGADFRPKYYPVVRVLLAEQRAPLARIAAAAGVTHSAASQTVAEMARRGLVTLRPSAVDARERLVALSARGRRACDALAPLWAATAQAAAELDTELAAPLGAVAAEALHALARRPFAARIRDALAAGADRPATPPRGAS